MNVLFGIVVWLLSLFSLLFLIGIFGWVGPGELLIAAAIATVATVAVVRRQRAS